MADQKMPQRIELQNVGKKARIVSGFKMGHKGTIKHFDGSCYEIELEPGLVVHELPTRVLIDDDATYAPVNHIASLTSAGVAGELAKETPELTETESLRRQVAQLTADKLTLQAKIVTAESQIVAAEQRFEATRDQNVALTKELATVKTLATEAQQTVEQLQRDMKDDDDVLFNIEKERDELKKELELARDFAKKEAEAWQRQFDSIRTSEVEALKLVEQQRDAAKAEVAKLTHDLEVSRQQVAVFAKRLKTQKRQQVEVKTLSQDLNALYDADAIREKADTELAQRLNDGWVVMPNGISIMQYYSKENEHIYYTRIVTLSRPIRTTPQPPKREAIVEQPAPVKTVVADTMIFPPAPTPAGIPVTLNEKPVTFQDALRLAIAGKMDMDEALAIGNTQAMNKGREVFQQRQQQPRSTYSNPFMLKG